MRIDLLPCVDKQTVSQVCGRECRFKMKVQLEQTVCRVDCTWSIMLFSPYEPFQSKHQLARSCQNEWIVASNASDSLIGLDHIIS